jgi:predicted membrane protein
MNLGKPRGKTMALLLIVAGALLFLDNLGVIPLHDLEAYWPVWMIVVGGWIFENRRSIVGVILAGGFVVTGILLILGNLHIIPVTEDVVWPIFLIVLGIILLVRPFNFTEWSARAREASIERRRQRREGRKHWHGTTARQTFSGDSLREAIVFSSINRRVETQQFEGGSLEVVFGAIEIDLSGAAISSANRTAKLELSAVFGGIDIIVPQSWKVLLQATAVFGGCDDKSLPSRPEPGSEPATLIVTGGAVFGGITIRN